MDITSSKKRLILAGLILGVFTALLAYFGNPANMAICIACFIRDTAGAMKLHQAEVVQYVRPEITGIVLGVFIISIVTKEYRATAGSAPLLRFVLGMIMMIGALVFLGCPLRMVIRMAAGDLNAYIALIGFVLGVYTGTLALRRGFSLGRSYDTKVSNGYVLPVLLTIVLILSLTTSLMAVSVRGPGSKHAPVLIALLAGGVFGVISQKCRTCFAGSVRDIVLMRNFDLISVIGGLFIVMLGYNLLNGKFELSFYYQPIAHSKHIWNLLGMYLVGFAAVLAGGCPLRQLVLAGQGSGDAAVTILGLFVGAAICHNFNLASVAASAPLETASARPVSGGPSVYGMAAVIISIVVLFLIGFVPGKEKT